MTHFKRGARVRLWASVCTGSVDLQPTDYYGTVLGMFRGEHEFVACDFGRGSQWVMRELLTCAFEDTHNDDVTREPFCDNCGWQRPQAKPIETPFQKTLHEQREAIERGLTTLGYPLHFIQVTKETLP